MDAGNDSDADGKTNLGEHTAGTNPIQKEAVARGGGGGGTIRPIELLLLTALLIVLLTSEFKYRNSDISRN